MLLGTFAVFPAYQDDFFLNKQKMKCGDLRRDDLRSEANVFLSLNLGSRKILWFINKLLIGLFNQLSKMS